MLQLLLKNMALRRKLLLFSCSIPSLTTTTPQTLGDDFEFSSQLINADIIEKHFIGARARLFQTLLRQGYQGMLLASDEAWMAYGWMATPVTPPPIHLPLQQKGRYWIFYCHTAVNHRGQGHYQRILNLLLQEAARQGGVGQTMFIDTTVDNGASRKAILRVGFNSCGTIITLNLPRCKPFYGKLDSLAPHPPMPERKF